MPELPEVTVIVNGLNKKLKGLEFKSVEYDWPKGFQWGDYSEKDLRGAKVLGVERRGKVIVINLVRNSGPVSSFLPASAPQPFSSKIDNPNGKLRSEKGGVRAVGSPSRTATRITILVHLKLTGQLVYQDKKTRIAGGHPIPPLNLPSPNKTTRATFEFTNGGHLYFNDMRKFGWVKIVESDEGLVRSAIGILGPDALEISYKEFAERIKKKPQSRIKKLLMDQAFISGVGNIYADESLWLAKVHPSRSIVSLSDSEIKAIHKGIKGSMNLSIKLGGSSANSYVGSGGEKGLFLNFANAYHMTGLPCKRCKTPIVRKKMDGRSAHFCPKCQKLK